MLHKAWNSKGEMPYCFPRSSIKFQGHTVQNITELTQIGHFRTIGRSQLSNPSDLPCLTQGRNQNRLHNLWITTNSAKQQPYRRVSNLVVFQNFAKHRNLHLITTNPKYISRISYSSISMQIRIAWHFLCVIWFIFVWYHTRIWCQEICA